jgi:hypothetical protein
MPEFDNIQTAFQWWIENVYPKLSSKDKKTSRFAKSDFLTNRPISEKRIKEIMLKYGTIEQKIIYTENNF